jgi:hypothetical protein
MQKDLPLSREILRELTSQNGRWYLSFPTGILRHTEAENARKPKGKQALRGPAFSEKNR